MIEEFGGPGRGRTYGPLIGVYTGRFFTALVVAKVSPFIVGVFHSLSADKPRDLVVA